jgi:hypothetical protein
MRGCPIGQAAPREVPPCDDIIDPDMSTIEANGEPK